ncbi:MAG: SIMPL domain-containing protein [Verrucomicrobia bacterium]|nr:SIMPL domain-containing protein [Verrucomicrobiota bacterium]
METTPSRPHLFGLLAGLFLAAGLAAASFILANAWTRIAESQVINVTGSARQDVRSDLALWRCQFSVEAPTLLAANEKLQADLAKVEAFLRSRSVTDYSLAPVQIREATARVKNDDGETVPQRVGYHLVQAVGVKSADIDRMLRLSRESGQLLGEGVALVSGGIDFLYTKAGEAKVTMMSEATKDARARAEQIAAQGGRRIKELRTARMGVVQINPIYSGATSWEGNNDTSSVDKTITATVTATFSLR